MKILIIKHWVFKKIWKKNHKRLLLSTLVKKHIMLSLHSIIMGLSIINRSLCIFVQITKWVVLISMMSINDKWLNAAWEM